MSKTYSKRVFSGKDVPFVGIADGHGALFRGNSVEFSLNLVYHTVMKMRDGQSLYIKCDDSIKNGLVGIGRTVCEGNNIWSELV